MKPVVKTICFALTLMLAGCGSEQEGGQNGYQTKEDAKPLNEREKIIEAYNAASSGNEAFLKEVKIKDFKKELKKSNLPANYTYRIVHKTTRSSSLYADCTLAVDRISEDQKFALVTQKCGDGNIDGKTYMVNDGGWKVPVKK